MESVELLRNLILLVLVLAPVVCVNRIFRVVYAPALVRVGVSRMALRHVSLPRRLPKHGDPGSRTDFVL